METALEPVSSATITKAVKDFRHSMSPNITMYACATCSVRCIEENGIPNFCEFSILRLGLMKVPDSLIEVNNIC